MVGEYGPRASMIASMIAILSFVIENIDLYTPCADPGGGGGFPGAGPPLEFWQKCGYRVREWDRFHIEQHLC